MPGGCTDESGARCDVTLTSAAVPGLPGTFTNNTQCHMRATNLTTFAPQMNEAYEFVEDVEFSNEDGTTFTIPAGATITLN